MYLVIKLKKDILKLVTSRNLFNTDETIIVALSGGVDSMVLFDILYKLNKNLVIAHVNHNKRKESIAEYEYLFNFAKKKNIPFEGLTLEGNQEGNFQQEARLRRYDFFRAVAAKYASHKIAVAHHIDDQVETVLMRIVRGTSFSGYTGIKEIRSDRNVSIIRPLLYIKKEDLLSYAKENHITFFEDATNKKDIYTRNRFRNTIIPLLKKENPNLDMKILQLAEYIDSADELIENLKSEFIKNHSFHNNVNLIEFNKQNMIVKIKIIQHIVNLATNDTVELSYELYHNIINMCLNDEPNQQIALSKNYDFVKEYDVIYVKKLDEIKPVNIVINKLGEYFVSDNHSFIFTLDKMVQNNSNYIELCYNSDIFPLFIRHRIPGDRMHFSYGTKKVKDILIDKKIPKSIRNRLLVITDENSVLWIPGIKKSPNKKECKTKMYIYEVNE
jgi:tRNA(Ile)-lysidine synthetase-like protein